MSDEKQILSRRQFVRVVRNGMVLFMLPDPVRLSEAGTTLETPTPIPMEPSQSTVFKFFRGDETATVRAIIARIFPSGDTPGALEAKVDIFLDRILVDVYPGYQTTYREGLQRVNAIARAMFNRHFDRCTADQQDSMLEKMERREISSWAESGDFFALIRMHTIEGMFSDPRYGGNAGGVGWKLLGAAGHH